MLNYYLFNSHLDILSNFYSKIKNSNNFYIEKIINFKKWIKILKYLLPSNFKNNIYLEKNKIK